MPAPGAKPGDDDKEKFEVDRTKLAPRPGAKPVNRGPKGQRTTATAVISAGDAGDDKAPDADEVAPASDEATEASAAKAAAVSKPKPGTKPSASGKSSSSS